MLKINRKMPFCNLLMVQPSYNDTVFSYINAAHCKNIVHNKLEFSKKKNTVPVHKTQDYQKHYT